MFRKLLHPLLPAYANRSLSPWLTWMVELWVKYDLVASNELKGLQHLRKAVQAQTVNKPSLEVWRSIQKRTSVELTSSAPLVRGSGFWQAWGLGMALIALSLMLFWYVLPPGIVLQWTVSGNNPAAFRVYRTRADQPQNYQLLDEISAGISLNSLDARVFTYRDLFLLPGQGYEYRIEMIDHNGLAYSQTIMSTAFQALPGQLALLLSFILFAYGLFLALPKFSSLPEKLRIF